MLTVQVLSIRCVAWEWRAQKGQQHRVYVNNFESHSSSHVPIQQRSHIARDAVCETLEMVSLSCRECVTLIIPPPWKDIYSRFGKQMKINAMCRLGGNANEILALLHGLCHIHFPFHEAARSFTSYLSRIRWNSTSIFPRLRSGTAGVVWVIYFGERLSHDVGAPIVAYQLHTVAMINFCMNAKEHAVPRTARGLCTANYYGSRTFNAQDRCCMTKARLLPYYILQS